VARVTFLVSREVDALRAIDGWDADVAAAGVARADGVVAVHGPHDRELPWASVTKILTGVAFLVALEEGTVDLDEPAGPPGATLRHLLAHASGLQVDGERPITEPGRRRIYSNTGIELAARLLEDRAEMPFADYFAAAVVHPLGLAGRLAGSPAHGYRGPLDDLLALGRELLEPTLVAAETLAEATTVQFPGLTGVLPGFGRMEPNDWGLTFELRDSKSPHWTGSLNAERTFGHFGRSGTFLWVDPDAGLACAVLTDRPFGDWAKEAWPPFSDAVLRS
jgi:CubicO group peptidase (beta-lactamase class C family)